MNDESIAHKEASHATQRVTEVIRDFVASIPPSHERHADDPDKRARAVSQSAARTAALTAGSLAIPPGPLGWLTILPEIVAVWRIQSQMIADLAGVYGVDATLTQEQMMYCLFRHSAAQAVRDLAVRVADRVLVRQASLRVTQRVVKLLLRM